jgi:hypothetical protein
MFWDLLILSILRGSGFLWLRSAGLDLGCVQGRRTLLWRADEFPYGRDDGRR